MSGFCSANFMQSPFKKQMEQANYQPFANGTNSVKQGMDRDIQESLNIFSRLSNSMPSMRNENIWKIQETDADLPVVSEKLREEFLTNIRPQQKADRSLAIGLNKGLKKANDPSRCKTQKGETQNLPEKQATSPTALNGGLYPHFLAEA